jgi:hypothetical protein
VSVTLPRETLQANYICFSDTRLSARAIFLKSLTMLTDGCFRQCPSHLSHHLKVTVQAPYLLGRHHIWKVHGHNPSVDMNLIPCFEPTRLRQQGETFPLSTPSAKSISCIRYTSDAFPAEVKKPAT